MTTPLENLLALLAGWLHRGSPQQYEERELIEMINALRVVIETREKGNK